MTISGLFLFHVNSHQYTNMTTQHFYAFNYGYNNYNDYTPNEVNLGDYIQSLAAMGFYPHIDGYTDRHNCLQEPRHEKVKIIANGWYSLDDNHHTFHPKYDPLFVAFHINNINQPHQPPKSLSYLKEKSLIHPIGCRDYSTLSYLQKYNINSYFSSCLTTTLDRTRFTKTDQRSGVVFCDLPALVAPKLFPLNRFLTQWKKYNKLNKLIKQEISSLPQSKITTTTHSASLTTTHEERFSLAKDLLAKYSSAELVITSRIHCALPCLALGTPVILIAPYDDLRYKGIGELLNHVYLDGQSITEVKINRDHAGKIKNPDNYKVFAEQLKSTCLKFVTE